MARDHIFGVCSEQGPRAGQENDYATSCSPEFKFAGYQYDSEGGNYYAYARYYNPRLGRFMSPDPLGGNVGNPQSLNRYSYVLNNPENFVDPLGLKCIHTDDGQPADDGTLPKCKKKSVWAPYTLTVNGGPVELYQLLFEISQMSEPLEPPLVFAKLPFMGGPRPLIRPEKPQTQASKQNYQQCMSSFNNTAVGKATSFFSVLNFFSNLGDWLGFGTAKAAGVGVLKAETSSTVTDYSITAGTATTATTGLETVVAVGSKALGVAGSIAVVGGTAVDAQQRLTCAGLINPNDAAALGSPILPIFP